MFSVAKWNYKTKNKETMPFLSNSSLNIVQIHSDCPKSLVWRYRLFNIKLQRLLITKAAAWVTRNAISSKIALSMNMFKQN